MGRDALDRGDYREASLVFESILSLFPQSRTAHIGLGVAYHLQYWDSSTGDDFLLAYPGALEIEYVYLLERGPRDLDALRQAIDQYKQVLAIEPGNSYAQNNLGVALAELHQPEQAEQTLREALRVSNRDFTMFNLGLLLTRRYVSAPDETQHAEQETAFRTEALSLMQAYLRQIPHDTVAVQYLKELQEALP
jgi:Flp pilus assembly protein TadD